MVSLKTRDFSYLPPAGIKPIRDNKLSGFFPDLWIDWRDSPGRPRYETSCAYLVLRVRSDPQSSVPLDRPDPDVGGKSKIKLLLSSIKSLVENTSSNLRIIYTHA